MRVLVLGSGAKDHAVAWWISQSHFLDGLFVAPGNVGTAAIAENIDIDPADFDQVWKTVREKKIDYVFIGTEEPLVAGIVDKLNDKGIETFGSPLRALKLEGDKNFSRMFTDRHDIPTAGHKMFEDTQSLGSWLSEHKGERYVVKSNSVAPSRLMIDSSDSKALLEFASSLFASGPVILEDHLCGTPVTVTCLCDSKGGYLVLPFSSDYMKSGDYQGVPTGGMGSVCPVPLDAGSAAAIRERIIDPTLNALKEENLSYRGVLTFSVIITSDGPVLVDYHVRFNDPATQALIPLIRSDALDIINALREDRIGSYPLEVSSQSSVALVIASQGYPAEPVLGREVKDVPSYVFTNSFPSICPLWFFGGVQEKDGKMLTTSGRCVTVVGSGENIMKANRKAYGGVAPIKIQGAWFRPDIGDRFFES